MKNDRRVFRPSSAVSSPRPAIPHASQPAVCRVAMMMLPAAIISENGIRLSIITYGNSNGLKS
jgi:hypothetical protein